MAEVDRRAQRWERICLDPSQPVSARVKQRQQQQLQRLLQLLDVGLLERQRDRSRA